jgi:hypothetical protein
MNILPDEMAATGRVVKRRLAFFERFKSCESNKKGTKCVQNNVETWITQK